MLKKYWRNKEEEDDLKLKVCCVSQSPVLLDARQRFFAPYLVMLLSELRTFRKLHFRFLN